MILRKTFTGLGILPVESALATHLWVLHIILVIDDLKDAASDLSSKLTQDAICLKGLNH